MGRAVNEGANPRGSIPKPDTGERWRDVGRAVNDGANPRGLIPKPDMAERGRDVGREKKAASHVGEAALIQKLCARPDQVNWNSMMRIPSLVM